MKAMKCNQLGGPESCTEEFHADTWEQVQELSKKHGMEMAQKGDQEHIDAMNKMKDQMGDPEEMQKWMEEKKMEFENSSEA